MLATEAAYCYDIGSTESELKYTKVLKCLELPAEMKWPTDSYICFGDDLIRSLGKSFSVTACNIHIAFVLFALSLEPTIALKIKMN
jgi:hypothetical protein